MKKLFVVPLAIALFGAGCSSQDVNPQAQPTSTMPVAVAPAVAPPTAPAKAPAPLIATKNTFEKPDSGSRTGYTEIYSTRGHGGTDSESGPFKSAGGTLKIVAITYTNNPTGSSSTFELKSENGYALLNTKANVYSKTPGTVNGQTIVKGARAGTYHVNVTSTVDWEIHVYQSK